MRIVDFDDNMPCEFEGCDTACDILVYSSNQERVVACCNKHALVLVDERFPEYTESCPNCDCLIPIN